MEKSIQVECSATLGRKHRIEAFRAFIEQNRQTKNYRQLIAFFSLEHGLRDVVVRQYLKLLLDSGIYYKWKGNLLTLSEYDKAVEEWDKQKEKETEARRLQREGFLEEDFQPPEAEIQE